MFFVEARYHRDASRVGAQVRYISHREEGLTNGRRRDIYGIGDRYRAMRGDERAVCRARPATPRPEGTRFAPT